MGRAIDMENKLDVIDRRLKLVEDALEELVQTRVHHVDLHNDTRNVMAEGIGIEPDEEFTPPAGTRKKTATKKTKKVESML
jgi:hypothetical protein